MSENPNINTESSACPVYPRPPKFIVEAIEQIDTPRRTIHAGEFLVVDPGIEPTSGKMVIVDDRCELWEGQEDISGVVRAVWSDAV